ncbi:MAG: LOG family protein [Verrucomicrobiota bacterium]
MNQIKSVPVPTEIEAKFKTFLKDLGIEDKTGYHQALLREQWKLNRDGTSPAEMRLFHRVVREMRYANKIFMPYRHVRKLCIFGSARTPFQRPESKSAHDFAKLMTESDFMTITGGGDGIMGAAQAGAGKEHSFGLNITLPFEQHANAVIEGDPKLINFHYFFTRKLFFLRESHAVALFPGGFGTMDEGFEALTLIQTGKARVIPLVMVDAPGGNFWKTFDHYIREHIFADGLISKEDFHLYKITDNLQEARKEIINFYYNFHSYRYVKDHLVIRTQREVPEGALKRLQEDFEDIILPGSSIQQKTAFPEEANEPEIAHLPRLVLNFNRRAIGRLRQLINRLNDF